MKSHVQQTGQLSNWCHTHNLYSLLLIPHPQSIHYYWCHTHNWLASCDGQPVPVSWVRMENTVNATMEHFILCLRESDREIVCNGTAYEAVGHTQPGNPLFWVYLFLYIFLVLFAGEREWNHSSKPVQMSLISLTGPGQGEVSSILAQFSDYEGNPTGLLCLFSLLV